MSEQLLKAILQLFAIIAKEDGVDQAERSNIKEFLLENLNEDAALRFMDWVDEYFQSNGTTDPKSKDAIHQSKDDFVAIDTNSRQLNKELTQQQKMVLILTMLELILADGQISEWETKLVDYIGKGIRVKEEDVAIREDKL